MYIEYKIVTTGILYIIPYFIYFKNKLGVIPLCNIELHYLEKICNFCPFNFKNYFPPYLSGEMIGIKLKKSFINNNEWSSDPPKQSVPDIHVNDLIKVLHGIFEIFTV